MPLSDHEQRMLDEIESALYAEDPKFASSVRGQSLRAPTAKRRLQGLALFLVGLVMLVSGIPFSASVNHMFLIVSVVGFIVMFAGVVFAMTGPPMGTGRRQADSTRPNGAVSRRARASGSSFASRMEDRFRRRFDR